jgi:hypothetical protein
VSNSDTAPRDETPDSFFKTLQSGVLSTLPALSALVFVIVAVKVFRASMMESTTTVAIVSTANAVALLKGVILTLLPGFLAGLTAISIWWWASVVPRRTETEQREPARTALLAPQAAFAWSMIIVAFFTVWWPVFLILLAPLLATTAALLPHAIAENRRAPTSNSAKFALSAVCPVLAIVGLATARLVDGLSWPALIVLLLLILLGPSTLVYGWFQSGAGVPLRGSLKAFGIAAAAVFIGLLTLSASVWLPLRVITITPGHNPPVLKHGQQLPRVFAAFVLNRDAHGASLLTDSPRAVIELQTEAIAEAMPLCVPPESKWRILTTRASQVLGLDADPHSPYPTCPRIPQQLLGGG